MDILIGKHGNQPFKLTESTISREHAVLHVDKATGRMTLRDNNSTNGTWIMTKDRGFKRITGEVPVGPETLVRLGERFTFTVKKLLEKPEEPPMDISSLRNLYEIYMQNKMTLESKTSSIMMWRIAGMSLGGVLAGVISMLLPDDFVGDETVGNMVKFGGTALAIAISFVAVEIMNKNLIRRKDQNERFFKEKYCCPKCGFHFGPKIYNNILAEGKCPNNNCKCKFVGK